ncbi:MAG: hypothetical protein ACYC4U_30280 [Pirellulaceae bacterium]
MRHAFIYFNVPAGIFRRLSRAILISTALILAGSMVSAAHGQAADQDLADANVSDPERQQETLDWLDKYMTDSALMRAEEVAKIRTAITQMTPSQLERWLGQTRQLREYVESPQWQETRKWLQGFLKVQAIYSDQEIQQFREQLFNADAEQMLAMLQRIQAKHESMVWMHQASDKSRQLDVKARNASVARQDAATKTARTAAARSNPLFGSAGNASRGAKPNSGYRIPGPLIDSRTVAQWSVFRGIW